jgi:hypothetical protein
MTYQTKKEEKKQEPLYIKIITSLAISFILTIVLMIFTFIVFGSASFASSIFNLELDVKKVLFISIIIIGYSLIVDHLIFTAVRYIVGENIILIGILSIIRFMIFFLIGLSFSLDADTNFIFSIVFTILFLLVDVFNLKDKKVNE